MFIYTDDDLKNSAKQLDNRIDTYHIIPEHSRECNNYLSYVSVGYDKNANHNEQVCRLLKVIKTHGYENKTKLLHIS